MPQRMCCRWMCRVGLRAIPGLIQARAVRAERTISFLGLKLGFYLGEGPNCTGIVMCDLLDVARGCVRRHRAVGVADR